MLYSRRCHRGKRFGRPGDAPPSSLTFVNKRRSRRNRSGPKDSSCPCFWLSFVSRSDWQKVALPIAHRAIGIKDSLRQLLMDRVFLHSLFIDGDAEPGFPIRPHDATLFLDRESFLHDLLPPWDVVMHGLADDVTRLGEAKLQRRRRAHRSLRIM